MQRSTSSEKLRKIPGRKEKKKKKKKNQTKKPIKKTKQKKTSKKGYAGGRSENYAKKKRFLSTASTISLFTIVQVLQLRGETAFFSGGDFLFLFVLKDESVFD